MIEKKYFSMVCMNLKIHIFLYVKTQYLNSENHPKNLNYLKQFTEKLMRKKYIHTQDGQTITFLILHFCTVYTTIKPK